MAILPLQQPPQYATGMQSPLAAATEGLQLGAGLAQTQLAGEAQQEARQQSAQRQAAMQQYMQNPTMQGLLQIAPMLPPEMVKNISEANKALSEEQRTNALQFGGTVLGFLEAGRTEDAVAVLRDRAAAYRNSGDQMNATALDRLVRIAEVDPSAAKAFIGVNMAAMPGGQAFIQGLAGIGGEQRAQELQPTAVRTAGATATTQEATAGVAPIRAGAEAARAVAQAQNEASPGLPEAATVRVNDAFTASDAARTRAGQLTELNDKITAAVRDDTTGSLGQLGRGGRRFLELFGGSTEYARLQREFVRLRNAEVVRALPPGPATDRDIQLIASGFPGENGSTEEIQQFLSAASRIAAYESDYNRFRGMFMDANRGSMGRAQRSFEIDGVTIPAGADMSSAFRRVITPRIEAQRNTQTLQDDPILRRFVQPPAGQ
jgi:hypothetical protein